VTGDSLYWYASIFLGLFLTGIGLPPLPEEAGILYAAGLCALHPEAVRWPLAWLMTGLGIVCADLVLYGAGRRWGPRLFEYRWVQKVMSTERRERIEKRFHQHGMKLLLLARFLPPLRTGIFLIAGAARYSFFKFLLADLIYAVFGVGLFFFGGTWLVDLLKQAGHWAIYIVAGPVVLFGLYKYYQYLRKRELAATPQPPVSVLEGPAGAVPPGQPATDPAAAPAARKEAEEALKD
jgi:membrane protein DedA with SNARE-associated domain